MLVNEKKPIENKTPEHLSFSCKEWPKDFYHFGKNQKYLIRTYGCQANAHDTEKIAGILELMGFVQTKDIAEANIIILNTCAIRKNAEDKVFGQVGFLKKQKNKRHVIFGICGCMSQEKQVLSSLLKTYPYIDFVIGTHNIEQIADVIYQCVKQKKQIVNVYDNRCEIIENWPYCRELSHKAWVEIMYGCNQFCSYCVVPYTRGRIRSRNKQDILDEINDLIKAGYQEVTLLGQNVNSYGIDLPDHDYFFADLLQDVAKLPIQRIRFATSNPWNFHRKIIDVMVANKNIMPYIHLPIQSGDEQILKEMNRAMPIQKYFDLIKYIREQIPRCAISTDLIVGFPNETKEQFQHTLDLYHAIKFDNAYTFIYSPREYTPAAKIKDLVTFQEKNERLQELNKLVRYYAKWNNEKYLGIITQVLIDGASKTDPSKLTGYNPQWKVVNFIGNGKIGQTVNVKITKVNHFSLEGEMISD